MPKIEPQSSLQQPTLKQLDVLVTRPAHQATHLCELIEQAGGRAIPFPVITIAPPVDEAAVAAQLSHIKEFDLAIFISANAVSYCRQLLNGALPETLKLAVVGKATARQLHTSFARQPDVLPEHGFNSEALLALPALQQVKGQRIIILRGEDGRALLGDTLSERGAEVSYANLYRRVQPEVDAATIKQLVEHTAVDIIVTTSGEGLENLCAMLGETYRAWLCRLPLVVVHQRLCDRARQLGFTAEVLIAREPADEAILECIQAWAQQR